MIEENIVENMIIEKDVTRQSLQCHHHHAVSKVLEIILHYFTRPKGEKFQIRVH